MTIDEIIALAREQGLPETETEGVFRVNADDLGRMLAAAATKAPGDGGASMTDHWCKYCNGMNTHNCQFNTNLPRMKIYSCHATLVRTAALEEAARVTGEFAQKWWSIHCASNKHMETTRKAHDDFCALQAAIRAMKEQP